MLVNLSVASPLLVTVPILTSAGTEMCDSNTVVPAANPKTGGKMLPFNATERGPGTGAVMPADP